MSSFSLLEFDDAKIRAWPCGVDRIILEEVIIVQSSFQTGSLSQLNPHVQSNSDHTARG